MTDSPNEHSKYKLLLKLKGLSENPTITFPLSVEYKHGDFSKSSVVSAVPASQGGFKFSDCLVAKETIKFLKNDQALLTVKTPSQNLCKCSIDLFSYTAQVAPGKQSTFAIEKPTEGSGKVFLSLVLLRADNRSVGTPDAQRLSSKSGPDKPHKRKDKGDKDKDTKRSGSKKPSSTSRHLASEDADSDSKSENKKGKSSHGSKKSKKDVREGRDEKRENKDKKSSSRMASASPTSQEEITNNYPKFTETSPDMSSDSNEAEEGGSSGPRRRPKRSDRMANPSSKLYSSLPHSMNNPSRVKEHRRQVSASRVQAALSAAPTSDHGPAAASPSPPTGRPGPRPVGKEESFGRPMRSQKYKTMDGIVSKSNKESDLSGGAISPRYGSLKFGQLDEPITVESYKQHYLDMRCEEDQSFLFDMFFKGDLNMPDPYSLPQVLFKSLVHWNLLEMEPPKALEAVIDGSLLAIKNSENSKKQLFTWISNISVLTFMAYQEAWLVGEPAQKNLKSFLVQLNELLVHAFEATINNLDARINPREVFANALSNSRSNPDLSKWLSGLREYKELTLNHFIFPVLHTHFWSRVFLVFMVEMVAVIRGEGATSMNQGIKLKMIVGQIEDWANSNLGKEMASKASSIFESVREIANVLSIGSKEDLLIDVVRTSVWPSLRPALLYDVLKLYQPELSLEKPVPQPLLKKLLDLEKELPVDRNDFDFVKSRIKPLKFEISQEFQTIVSIPIKDIPRAITERPGFSFLRKLLTESSTRDTMSESEHW